jgi:hypothetical protein
MNLRGTILAGVTAATLLASGAVLASAINDLPQDAVPVQDPTAALNRQTSPSTTPPVRRGFFASFGLIDKGLT